MVLHNVELMIQCVGNIIGIMQHSAYRPNNHILFVMFIVLCVCCCYRVQCCDSCVCAEGR